MQRQECNERNVRIRESGRFQTPRGQLVESPWAGSMMNVVFILNVAYASGRSQETELMVLYHNDPKQLRIIADDAGVIL